MKKAGNYLKLHLVASVPWGQDLREEVVTVSQPTGGSILELPGPRERPVRPALDLLAAPGGIAARIVRGDGHVQPVVARIRPVRYVAVDEPPLAVCAREDGGLWVLESSVLTNYDDAGSRRFTVPVTAASLQSGGENRTWLVSLESVSFVESDGSIRGPYSWLGGLQVAAFGSDLCALTKKPPRQLICIMPAGEINVRDVNPEPGPFEALLAATDSGLITLSGGTLRRYNGPVRARSWWSNQRAWRPMVAHSFLADPVRMFSCGLEKVHLFGCRCRATCLRWAPFALSAWMATASWYTVKIRHFGMRILT